MAGSLWSSMPFVQKAGGAGKSDDRSPDAAIVDDDVNVSKLRLFSTNFEHVTKSHHEIAFCHPFSKRSAAALILLFLSYFNSIN